MLAIFSAQGIRNRTFFDQRARKTLLEASQIAFPARPALKGVGAPGGGAQHRAAWTPYCFRSWAQ
jgi:hypothetical protein